MFLCDILKLIATSQVLSVMGIMIIACGFIFGAKKDALGITLNMDTFRTYLIIGTICILIGIAAAALWAINCPVSLTWRSGCLT